MKKLEIVSYQHMDWAITDAAIRGIRIIVVNRNPDKQMLSLKEFREYLTTQFDNYSLCRHIFSLHYPQHKIARTTPNEI
jgi:hypothetical protein